MGHTYVTITGLHHYLGMKPFKVGRIVRLEKEEGNLYDDDAIKVTLPYIDTVGYVANSVSTVYLGTQCAGRIGQMMGEGTAYARVLFLTHSSVIAEVITDEEAKKLGIAFPSEPVLEQTSEHEILPV